MNSPQELRNLAAAYEHRGAELAASQALQRYRSHNADEFIAEAANCFTIAKGLYSLADRAGDKPPAIYDTGSSSRPHSEDRFGNRVEGQNER